MKQALIKADGNEAAQFHARVGLLYASIGKDDRCRCDTLPAPIDQDTRKQLQEYRRNLHARLQPISLSVAERERAGSAIALFLGCYLNVRTSDPAGTTLAYVSTLLDQPLFAIMEALDDFRGGRVYDIGTEGQRIRFTLDHAPSAPRLLDQVKKRAADVQEARHKVTRLLAIEKIAEPEVSAAERDRVAEQLRRLADSLLMKRAHERQGEREKIRAEAQEARDRAERIQAEALRRNEEADWASQEQAAQ